MLKPNIVPEDKMTFFTIQADPDDAEEILDLQKLAYQSEAIIYNDWAIPPLTQTIAEIRSEFESKYFLKATSGNRIIGSVRAFLDETTCRIGRLIVHPQFRKKGIGTLLMERIEGIFPSATRFELFTGSRSITNIRLYRRLGYHIVGEEDLSPAVRLVILEKPQQVYQPLFPLQCGPIKLIFEKLVDVEPGGELVPFYNFKIINKEGTKVGHINFKCGDTDHIKQCAGHIGYEIIPEYQGHSFAYFACNAIRPFARSFYNKVILTSDPENIPSIRTIEKLKANFLNEIIIPKHDPSYTSGSKKKWRYEWEL